MNISDFSDMTLILASGSPRRAQLLRQIGIEPVILPSDIAEATAKTLPADVVQDLSRQKADTVLETLSRMYAESSALSEKPQNRNPEGQADLQCGSLKPSLNPELPSGLRNRSSESGGPVILLSADTVVALDHRILGKPKSHEEAASMIRSLQGREHQVYTGVTLMKLVRDADRADLSGTGWGSGGSSGENSRDGLGVFRIASLSSFAEETHVRVFPMTEDEIRSYAMTDEPMDKAGAYGIQGTFAKFVEGIRGDYNNVVGLPVARICRTLKSL